MRTLVLYNPSARGGRALRQRQAFLKQLGRHGILFAAPEIRDAEDLIATATREARHGGWDVVLAAGGDGTAMAAATGLIAADVTHPPVLAIAPLGTGNDAAAQFGLNSPENVAQLLLRGTSQRIDTLEVSCVAHGTRTVRQALTVAAAGFAADVNHRVTPRLKRCLGRFLSYRFGVLSALPSLRNRVLTLRGNDFHDTGPMLTVIASNFEWAGGGTMRLGPGADPADGMAEVSVVRAVPRRQVLQQFMHLARGTHVQHPAIHYSRMNRIEMDGPIPTRVMADGDVLGMTPAVIRVNPSALAVLTLRATHGTANV